MPDALVLADGGRVLEGEGVEIQRGGGRLAGLQLLPTKGRSGSVVVVTVLRQEGQLWLLIVLVECARSVEVGRVSVHSLKQVGIGLGPQFVEGLQSTGSLSAP